MRNTLLGTAVGLAALVLVVAAHRAHGQDESAWQERMQQAQAALGRSDWPEAARQLESALGDAERFGPNDRRLAATLVQLGSVYNQVGEFAKAEPLLRRGAQAVEALFGSDHEAMAMVLAPWGVSLLQLSRPMDAVQQLERAHAVLEAHGKARSPDGVAILAVWAKALEQVGWYPTALSKVDEAIHTVEQTSGSSDPILVLLLERRASTLRKIGQAQEADQALGRAAALRAAASGAGKEGAPADPRYQGKTSRDWIEALQGTDRMQAYGTLLQADPSAVPVLVELVVAPSVPVRMAASHALAQLAPKDPERVLPVLVAALRDHALAVRCWAADGLGAIGPRAAPAVPALVATLKTHPRREPDLEGPQRYYADARMAAATALGSIGPLAKAALPDLRVALEDDAEIVRSAAKDALSKIDGPSSR